MRFLAAFLGAIATSCGNAEPHVHMEDLIRIGVDVEREVLAIEEALDRAGYARAQRIETDRFIALAFEQREGDRHAVRVVTRLGVQVSLDSHETDGVRVRHGPVHLVDREGGNDVDGDGIAEVIVARDGEQGSCIAVIRIDGDGRASAAAIEAESIAPGACAEGFEDVDGNGSLEALVALRWPDLAIDGEVPVVRAALELSDGAWRATASPVAFLDRELRAREQSLAEARAQRQFGAVHRIAVEIAAIRNMTGATRDSQLARYEEALSGLVFRPDDVERMRAVRAYIAAGWTAP